MIIELEIKKTNDNKVILNDTSPFQTDFIIFCCKKKFIHPKVLYIDGRKMERPWWFNVYKLILDGLKYLLKRDKQSILSAYPRCNYSMNIRKYLNNN